MTANAQPAFTFGVEMEMVYVHERSDFHQLTGIPAGQHPTASQRRNYVASILRHQLSIGYTTPSILGAVIVGDTQKTDYTSWTVTDDASIGASPEEVAKIYQITVDDACARLHWDQVELISPVFRFAQEQTWLPAFRQVQADLSLRAHLGASFCNESCGLHVHFALESPGPHIPWDANTPPAFPIRVLQHLIILWAYWEGNIESFHPFYRHSYYNIYASSLRATNTPVWKLGGWEEWAAHVYNSQSSDKLRRLLGGIHSPKYVKVHISPATERKRETLEFREHRGTTDAEEIRWWVVFIERVIRYCWSLAQTEWRFFLPGNVMMNTSNTEEMWGVIEMPEEGRGFLRGKIQEYAALDPEDIYLPSTEAGSDWAGSQTSVDRILDEEMTQLSLDDEDVDSNYSTEYRTADAIQPPAEDLGEMWDGVQPPQKDEAEIVDAIAEWGELAKYGREET